MTTNTDPVTAYLTNALAAQRKAKETAYRIDAAIVMIGAILVGAVHLSIPFFN